MGRTFRTIWMLVFLVPVLSFAQAKNYPYRAQTLEDEVQVYKDANFDSPVIATLPGGKIYDISSKKFNGAFYRLRVKPGQLGYVSDVDVRPLFQSGEGKKATAKKNDSRSENRSSPKRQKTFEFTQYGGFQYAQIQFKEDTMGDRREESLGFFGAKVSGPNLVVEGAMPTELNFLFHYGAPGYYEKLTGKTADGWIFLMDMMWQSYFPQGKNSLTFFGFGPLLKYSKFNASVTDASTGRTSDYSLEDIAVGAAFNLGIAVRLNRLALRGEVHYFWEKESYFGAGASLQFAF